MKANKTQPLATSVSEFIDTVEDEKRRRDSWKLLTLMENVTGEKPVMWGTSIVGFGTYHYKYASGREGDTVVVGFAPRKAALVLYGTLDSEQNMELSQKLGPITMGKGCLYIKDLTKIDTDTLSQMIQSAFEQKKLSNK